MGMLEKNTGDMQNPQVSVAHSELRTLSLHAKLVLCARYNVNWLSACKVTEHIKELEMLGFLKRTYSRRGQGRQIRYIHILEPDEIPRYVELLREDLGW